MNWYTYTVNEVEVEIDGIMYDAYGTIEIEYDIEPRDASVGETCDYIAAEPTGWMDLDLRLDGETAMTIINSSPVAIKEAAAKFIWQNCDDHIISKIATEEGR